MQPPKKKLRLMAILNVTPDSCYAPSCYLNTKEAIQRGIELYQQGADLIDIGGESSKPGALAVTVEEELKRVIPVIKGLIQEIPLPLSIDTMKPQVAAAALEAGASFINDITGFQDPAMQLLAASTGVEICVMHMQGTPLTMQIKPSYPQGVVAYLVEWFKKRVEILSAQGINQNQIILDPGIGFGKTVADNLLILQNLPLFKSLGFPLLLGASRKSFMSSILHKPRAELLSATLAIHTAAVLSGVAMIRVHDVVEHRDMINLMEHLI